MTRNKFGLPYIFDYVRGLDAQRLNNLEKMVETCPKSFRPLWVEKLKQFKKIIYDRKKRYLN